MNRLTLSLCLATAVVSVGITSFVYNAKNQSMIVDGPSDKNPHTSDSSNEELPLLQDKIASQLQQIHDLKNQLSIQTNASEKGGEVLSDFPRKSYMDQLLEDDPERHQRVLKKLQETHEQTAQALADSAEFLFNLDMSLMTPEQVENHQHLLSLIEASWVELDRMAGPEAENARTRLHQNVMAMHKAYQEERRIALEQFFQWQGYTAEQALALRNGIEEVYTKTEPANILPGTQFVGENMMISVEKREDLDASQSISINFGGRFFHGGVSSSAEETPSESETK